MTRLQKKRLLRLREFLTIHTAHLTAQQFEEAVKMRFALVTKSDGQLSFRGVETMNEASVAAADDIEAGLDEPTHLLDLDDGTTYEARVHVSVEWD